MRNDGWRRDWVPPVERTQSGSTSQFGLNPPPSSSTVLGGAGGL